jgi:hypothetical protein
LCITCGIAALFFRYHDTISAMKAVVLAIASTLASVAFQLSLLLYPQVFQPYGGALKYVWAAAAVFWLVWLGGVLRDRTKRQPSAPSQVSGAEASVAGSGNG